MAKKVDGKLPKEKARELEGPVRNFLDKYEGLGISRKAGRPTSG
jgi:hypothetical protein